MAYKVYFNKVVSVTSCRNFEYSLLSDKMAAFKKKTGLDWSFNRISFLDGCYYGCWDTKQQTRYITSLITGQAPSKIIVANIKECLEHTIEGSIDYMYFSRWLEEGFENIAIDGNNRAEAMEKYLAGKISIQHGEYIINGTSFIIDSKNDNFKTHPKILKDHIRESVTICICEYVVATRSDLSRLFININDGIKLNDQELRNAVLVPFADHVRNLAAEYAPKLKMIFKKGNYRYGVDEQIVLLAVFSAYGAAHGISKKDKDAAYDDNSSVWKNFIQSGGKKSIEETLDLIVKYGNAGFKDVSTLLNLHMLICHINKLKIKILDKEQFFKWFMASENSRIGSDLILVARNRGTKQMQSDYAGCCSATSAAFLKARQTFITEDFVKIPKSIVTEIDTERLFTNAQRYILWQRQEGKCLRTGKVIPQEDINNHELWAADHVIPYSLGGETSINNGELVCQKYNLKKGAKLNYNPVAEESLG